MLRHLIHQDAVLEVAGAAKGHLDHARALGKDLQAGPSKQLMLGAVGCRLFLDALEVMSPYVALLSTDCLLCPLNIHHQNDTLPTVVPTLQSVCILCAPMICDACEEEGYMSWGRRVVRQ